MSNSPVLQLLRNSSEFISGEEISRRLGITRAAIWKNMEALRRTGYTIEALPRVGYRLISIPDKLLPWEIKVGLDTDVIGHNIIYEEDLGSTMDEAVRLANDNAAEGTVIFAEHQTKGRGRMGKHWVSPAGTGLYLSLIIRPRIMLKDAAKLTLLTGVAVCEAVNGFTQAGAGIKWPNDILIGGKKLAGILTEMNAELDCIRFVVIGIGMNVNTPLSRLPKEAISLKAAIGKHCDRISFAREILRSFESWYKTLQQVGFDPVLDRWRELSCTLNKQITFRERDKEWSGKAIDIDNDGSLLVRLPDGKIVKRNAGEIVH